MKETTAVYSKCVIIQNSFITRGFISELQLGQYRRWAWAGGSETYCGIRANSLNVIEEGGSTTDGDRT